jgi:hypothetical protein
MTLSELLFILQSMEDDKREGASIFSSEKSLAAANSEDINVLQLDATFSPIPAKEHSRLYQLLIVHVVTFGRAIPVLHVPMTNKKEWLYTRVLEWLQNKCVCKRIFWRRWCDTEIFIWSFIAFQIH